MLMHKIENIGNMLTGEHNLPPHHYGEEKNYT